MSLVLIHLLASVSILVSSVVHWWLTMVKYKQRNCHDMQNKNMSNYLWKEKKLWNENLNGTVQVSNNLLLVCQKSKREVLHSNKGGYCCSLMSCYFVSILGINSIISWNKIEQKMAWRVQHYELGVSIQYRCVHTRYNLSRPMDKKNINSFFEPVWTIQIASRINMPT